MDLDATFRCGALFAFAVLASACGSSGSGSSDGGGPCEYDSTFDAIQAQIFDAKGCTNAACHGKADDPAGGLDLREGFALENLIRVDGQAGPFRLVFPGDQERSLLYLKLAAKEGRTDLTEWGVSGDPMPFGDMDPLSQDELDAVRAWIRSGAPGTTLVKGTEGLLGCSGPVDFDPNKMEPLDPPAADEGLQFYSGAYVLPAESEDEVCYATYYDFSAQIPAAAQLDCPEAWGQGRKCFSFGRNELAQDGQSHHSIISIYGAPSDPNGGEWGPWGCLGGASHGTACDPTDAAACGTRSQCSTPVVTAAACSGYPHAPADFSSLASLSGTSSSRVQLTGAQESVFVDEPVEGVYSVLPVDGFIAWNSHAFNLTTKDTTIEQWVNLDFIRDVDRRWEREQIFDVSRVFAMGTIPPFESREVCMTFTLPRYARLMTLSSHMHWHGKVFRIWAPPNQPCSGGSVSSVDTSCTAPEGAPMYENRLYDDPLYLYFEGDALPTFDGAEDAERTFKACALFDNGGDDISTLKLNSTSGYSQVCDSAGAVAGFATCGCTPDELACVGASNQGAACGGDDSVCGGGVCDACPLQGGMTTNDEMFIPLGSYFVQPPL
ncbi:MAG: hypothetical protein JRE82_08065 [Deltaproteobacteria bacterium]|nr:hypothetical protein [Deltaproteobacteria bacterium]MBW2718656.1 hypothetical protein [Deltaproteobacteria bacterium]